MASHARRDVERAGDEATGRVVVGVVWGGIVGGTSGARGGGVALGGDEARESRRAAEWGSDGDEIPGAHAERGGVGVRADLGVEVAGASGGVGVRREGDRGTPGLLTGIVEAVVRGPPRGDLPRGRGPAPVARSSAGSRTNARASASRVQGAAKPDGKHTPRGGPPAVVSPGRASSRRLARARTPAARVSGIPTIRHHDGAGGGRSIRRRFRKPERASRQ